MTIGDPASLGIGNNFLKFVVDIAEKYELDNIIHFSVAETKNKQYFCRIKNRFS